MKAIETKYKGYRFRSRLEARWAVFFDALGIEWRYEPEGFECCGARYLPDFYLPQSNTWVEVKPTDEALASDSDRLATMLDYGSPLPGVADSWPDTTGGLLILGQIPELDKGLPFFPLIQHCKGLLLMFAYFGEGGRLYAVRNPDAITDKRAIYSEPNGGIWTTAARYNQNLISIYVLRACEAARGARFEFGERGAPA